MIKKSKFTQKVLQERGGGIRFIQAEENGALCWFYLRVDPDKLEAYKVALPSGEFDIADFGQILESDWGEYPPPSVIDFMQKEYGYETPIFT